MKTKHTALPWTVEENESTFAVKAYDDEIAQVGKTMRTATIIKHKTSKANAEFITRACNSHYELLEIANGLINWGKGNFSDATLEQAYLVGLAVNAQEAIKKAEATND